MKSFENCWDVLNKTFVGKIIAKIMCLKGKHSRFNKRSKFIVQYLYGISLVDKLAIVDYIVDGVDLIIYNIVITNGSFISSRLNTTTTKN